LRERPNLVVCGDYNICHRAIDIHNPISNANSSGFLPAEREWMENFLNSGYIDSFRHLNPQPHQYTWWTFRANARARNLGWRIDYNMVSHGLRDRIAGAAILPDAVHSDHCPVLLDLADYGCSLSVFRFRKIRLKKFPVRSETSFASSATRSSRRSRS